MGKFERLALAGEEGYNYKAMYYFAYGSNMNLEHMRRICGWHFTVLGGVILEDYQFGPDTRGYANIRPAPGQKVYGLVYEVDQHCIIHWMNLKATRQSLVGQKW